MANNTFAKAGQIVESIVEGEDDMHGRRKWVIQKEIVIQTPDNQEDLMLTRNTVFLQKRSQDLGLDQAIGRVTQIDQNAPQKHQEGYYCEICDSLLKDSNAWLDHLNGKKHNRMLGMNLKVQRKDIIDVQLKFQQLKEKNQKNQFKILEKEKKNEKQVEVASVPQNIPNNEEQIKPLETQENATQVTIKQNIQIIEGQQDINDLYDSLNTNNSLNKKLKQTDDQVQNKEILLTQEKSNQPVEKPVVQNKLVNYGDSDDEDDEDDGLQDMLAGFGLPTNFSSKKK